MIHVSGVKVPRPARLSQTEKVRDSRGWPLLLGWTIPCDYYSAIYLEGDDEGAQPVNTFREPWRLIRPTYRTLGSPDYLRAHYQLEFKVIRCLRVPGVLLQNLSRNNEDVKV